MNEAIKTRELITLSGQSAPIQGTYHKPEDAKDGLGADGFARKRVGVLFVNSLFLPRTATGDSSVYWAESFANRGYPTFRVDLPGLGDSDAPLNTALLDFINAGGYESIAGGIVDELVARFVLSGMVIVGHCAGSVTALFGASASKQCRGVVLLDPYFFLPQQLKKSKAWKRLVRWGSESRFGGFLSNLYDRIKKIGLTVRGSRPPGNANVPLLKRWKEIAATRELPVLLFKAPGRKTAGTKPRTGEFDYLQHILTVAGRRSRVTVQLIDGTDHSFANRIGRAAVRQHAEHWLCENFPIVRREDSERADALAEARDQSVARENQAVCL